MLFNRLYAIDANWHHVREAPLTPIGVNYNGHRHSANAKHLVVSLWAWLPACGTVPYFVMASGHDLTFYTLVMNIVILALTIMAIDPGT